MDVINYIITYAFASIEACAAITSYGMEPCTKPACTALPGIA